MYVTTCTSSWAISSVATSGSLYTAKGKYLMQRVGPVQLVSIYIGPQREDVLSSDIFAWVSSEAHLLIGISMYLQAQHLRRIPLGTGGYPGHPSGVREMDESESKGEIRLVYCYTNKL